MFMLKMNETSGEEIPMPSLPSAAKEIKSGTSSSKLENVLVKNANPISNQKKPDPSKISQEELPVRPAEKEAKPPTIVHSNKSSAGWMGTKFISYLIVSTNLVFAVLT